ncbi:SH3-like domain-containing protein [Cognatiyoonia koreensis]|uniref:SH3-like domain-containing protein n=2 Tax=Cognatiyoonia koreensis TaxID=364200 RepID=A0A1I0QKJ5_9RHOB|nr:SH3 domain-containing protein [Cognatiyoonia koreensis]SEW27515.1 SH3-like domain-containing protein [Cognatiyoonia koreensis]
MNFRTVAAMCGVLTLMGLAAPINAQDVTQAANAPVAAPDFGPETNLPLPRFVSLKAAEANVRRGPSLSHRIDWVFQRRGMPLQVVAEYGHWRRVIDREGLGGWVHYTMLSGARTVIVDEDMLPLRTRPKPDAMENARLEVGVIARLNECERDWCYLNAGGYKGWAPKHVLWGVLPEELRD